MNKAIFFNLSFALSMFLGATKQAHACSQSMCGFGFTIPPVFSTIDRVPQLPTNLGGLL